MKFFCRSVVLFLFISINPAQAQSWQDSIVVLPLKTAVPENAKKLGAIKTGNHTTQLHCDYKAMTASAKQKARAMGGNLVKITQMTDPVFISKCYSIKADVYYVSNMPDYKVNKIASNIMPDAHTSYAVLYLYRLPDTTLGAASYKVHLNGDSVICTVKGKWKDSVRIYKEGATTLWAETEKRTALKLDIKFGAAYYIRCGLKTGEIRMIPALQLMDNSTGMAEYEKLGKKKKDTNVKYLQEVH